MNLFIESWDYLDTTSQRFSITGSEVPKVVSGGRRGTLACAADTENGWGAYTVLGSGNTLICGAAVAYPTASGLGTIFAIGDPTASGYANVLIKGFDDGSLAVYRAPNTLLALSPVNVLRLDGTYQYVEAKVLLASGVAGAVEVRVNGQPVITLNAVNTYNSGSLCPKTVTIWPQGRRYYDDLYINSGAGLTNFDFEGDVRIDTHYPIEDGTVEWNRLAGTSNFEMVDEHPPDEDASFNFTQHSTSRITDLFVRQALIPVLAGIRSLSVLARARSIALPPASGVMRAVLKIGDTTYSGAAFVPGSAYLYHASVWDVSPATTSGFRDVEFNGMLFGYRKDA